MSMSHSVLVNHSANCACGLLLFYNDGFRNEGVGENLRYGPKHMELVTIFNTASMKPETTMKQPCLCQEKVVVHTTKLSLNSLTMHHNHICASVNLINC